MKRNKNKKTMEMTIRIRSYSLFSTEFSLNCLFRFKSNSLFIFDRLKNQILQTHFYFCLFFFNSVYLDDSHNNQQGGMSGEGKLKVDYYSYLWLKTVNFQISKKKNMFKNLLHKNISKQNGNFFINQLSSVNSSSL